MHTISALFAHTNPPVKIRTAGAARRPKPWLYACAITLFSGLIHGSLQAADLTIRISKIPATKFDGAPWDDNHFKVFRQHREYPDVTLLVSDIFNRQVVPSGKGKTPYLDQNPDTVTPGSPLVFEYGEVAGIGFPLIVQVIDKDELKDDPMGGIVFDKPATKHTDTLEITVETTVPAPPVLNPPPPLESHLNLAGIILTCEGKLPYAIRKTYAGEDHMTQGHFWVQGPPQESSHSYLSLTSLGHSKLSLSEVALAFRSNFGLIFPDGAALGQARTSREMLSVGNILFLGRNKISQEFPVEVIGVTPYFAVLEAKASHPLIGIAIHGVFVDSDGEYWLFQQGTGVAGGELKIRRWANYFFGEDMWILMAKNLRAQIGSD